MFLKKYREKRLKILEERKRQQIFEDIVRRRVEDAKALSELKKKETPEQKKARIHKNRSEGQKKRWQSQYASDAWDDDDLDDIDPGYKYSKMYRETHGEEYR